MRGVALPARVTGMAPVVVAVLSPSVRLRDLLSARSSPVAHNNVNYQYNRTTQVAFQYGAKYVFDSFDSTSASGFTDLYGAEVRHDLGNRFDIGAHASLLHSWQSNVYTPSYGVSVGYSPVANMWLGVGYNFAGFRDRDFTSANATARGWYLYLRMKADQCTKDAGKQRQVMFEESNR